MIGVVLVAAIGVDFGVGVYAEYRLSRTVRQANGLDADPFVAILGFPFADQIGRHRYREVEIKAAAAEQPMVGRALLEATMHRVDLLDGSWLIGPGERLAVRRLESRIIIDTVHLGRYLGIRDLMVEAPPEQPGQPAGPTTESGISDSHGLVFTGTPRKAGFEHRVSVSVDLSMTGPELSTLVFTPTGILTGPDTADQDVPADRKAAVLGAFAGSLPQQHLPFGVRPTSQGARGSDVIIEGITEQVTITVEGFRQP